MCQSFAVIKNIFGSQVQGDNSSDRDLGAVQRGDAEMEQKMNRALRACLERSGGNPICSIHDQGAGGNGTRQMFFFVALIMRQKFDILNHIIIFR